MGAVSRTLFPNQLSRNDLIQVGKRERLGYSNVPCVAPGHLEISASAAVDVRSSRMPSPLNTVSPGSDARRPTLRHIVNRPPGCRQGPQPASPPVSATSASHPQHERGPKVPTQRHASSAPTPHTLSTRRPKPPAQAPTAASAATQRELPVVSARVLKVPSFGAPSGAPTRDEPACVKPTFADASAPCRNAAVVGASCCTGTLTTNAGTGAACSSRSPSVPSQPTKPAGA